MTDTPDLPTAHAAVANIVRALVTDDERMFAKMFEEGVTPPADFMDQMRTMRAAVTAYDGAVEAAKRVPFKALVEFALTSLGAGDVEAATLTLRTLSMATDYTTLVAPE